jgi:hypothetical protein
MLFSVKRKNLKTGVEEEEEENEVVEEGHKKHLHILLTSYVGGINTRRQVDIPLYFMSSQR